MYPVGQGLGLCPRKNQRVGMEIPLSVFPCPPETRLDFREHCLIQIQRTEPLLRLMTEIDTGPDGHTTVANGLAALIFRYITISP